MLGSAGGAALAPYASELFATRIRSEAQTLASPSIALLAALPLFGLAIVGAAFPETARRELEETSDERMPG